MIEVDALRFGVGSDALGYSTVWRVWYQKGKSDVYIAGRTTAGMFKVSLHESGQCHIGHTSYQAKKDGVASEKRLWKKWKHPEPVDGMAIPFYLIVPVQSLRPPLPNEPKSKPRPTVWIEPVPPQERREGMVPAVVFAFAFLHRQFTAQELTNRTPTDSMPIGGIQGLPSGQDLLVYCYPVFTDVHDARDPRNREVIRARFSPFDPRNARGSFIGQMTDGSAYLCELAGDEMA